MTLPIKTVGWQKLDSSEYTGRRRKREPRYRRYYSTFQMVGSVQRKGKCVAAVPAEGYFDHHWAIVRYRNWGNYRWCRLCFVRTGKFFRVNTDHDGRWANILFFTKKQRMAMVSEVAA